MKPIISAHCFACGPQNPIGLKLKIEGDANGVSTRFLPTAEHEGWEGVVHGGIVATLLDEVIAWICVKNGIRAVTARLDLRFRAPARVGEELSAHAEIVETRGRATKCKAEVRSNEGEVIAEAQALLLRVASFH